MDDRHLLAEGLSRSLLDESGLDAAPVDVYGLAAYLGLAAIPSRTSALAGPVLLYDDGLSVPRSRVRIAHELGHRLAENAGEDPSDEALAWAIGSALLIPATDLRRQIARSAWDLEGLPSRYGVSWEVLARRLVVVLGAVVSVWDNGRLSRRWRSPWLHSSGWERSAAPPWEADLAERTRALQAHTAEADGLVRAYSIVSPGWRRVVVVSELEAWEARARSSRSAQLRLPTTHSG